jgi:serine/threonine-protein kinase RIO1
MVRVWAEKELRNLRRLEQFGVRAPRVVEGKENVLVMEFLGTADGSVLPCSCTRAKRLMYIQSLSSSQRRRSGRL